MSSIYIATDLTNGKITQAKTLNEMAEKLGIGYGSVCRRLLKTSKFEDYEIKRVDSDYMTLHYNMDGKTVYEIIEMTGDKTFIIHGRFKRISMRHELAHRKVIKKFTSKDGVNVLVV